MNAAAYLRVSTAQQDWATQRKAIAQAASARGDVIRRVMGAAAEPVLTLSVPLEVEIGIGKSWGEAH